MSKPYLTDRQTIQAWADDGNERAARLLAQVPSAIAFGIDDDDVQIAFYSIVNAGAWLEEMLADHWHIEADQRDA